MKKKNNTCIEKCSTHSKGYLQIEDKQSIFQGFPPEAVLVCVTSLTKCSC